MNIYKINAPERATYLGEFMSELPVNCLFNKGVTGCGGTELALKNSKHTIIAMPFISLVNNKAEKREHKEGVLAVHGGTPIHEMEEYIRTHEVWKIAVVYDSLPKVIKVFQDLSINPYEKCFLLIDEYHVLFAQYVFRNKAVKELLNLAPNFKEVTYMTATPIEEEFMLIELKNLPIHEVT